MPMNTLNSAHTNGRRLPECPTEFETGIFMAAYDSPLQRRRRRVAIALLGLKHTLRGLLFSWPAYVLALAAFASGQVHALAYLLLLIPALGVSGAILLRGVRDDYRNRVRNVLLADRFVRELLFPAAP
jgi:hypothetical protein